MTSSRQKETKVTPEPLKQLQYRSFKYTIIIYHYDKSALTLRQFQSSLSRAQHGFILAVVSSHDRIAADHPITDPGDKLPKGRLEVAYLPNVYQGKGSALGFRIPHKDALKCKIHWLCFNQPIEDFINSQSTLAGHRLFDKVAILEKGGSGKKGATDGVREHVDWHKSLWEAQDPRTGWTLNEANEKFQKAQKRKATEVEEKEREAVPPIRLLSGPIYDEGPDESESEGEPGIPFDPKAAWCLTGELDSQGTPDLTWPM